MITLTEYAEANNLTDRDAMEYFMREWLGKRGQLYLLVYKDEADETPIEVRSVVEGFKGLETPGDLFYNFGFEAQP